MENISNFLRNLIQPKRQNKESSQIRTQKLSNPFNEIQLLIGHTDIVRIFLKIDDTRFASSSDDGLIMIWNAVTAEKHMVMTGHTKPVTCFLLLDEKTLVSGSVDRSLRFWNLELGQCTKTLPNCHESSVKCLTAISKDKFCSGGNDRYLCIWGNSGELVGSIERQEEENLHCLLAISNNRVITGSNSSLLLVYRTDTLKFCQLFTYHRESVRCLAYINDEMFASASLDGVIVVWQMESLTPLKKLYYPEKFFSSSADFRYYAYSVNHLLVLHEQYLAACIGNGFQIFDILTGECVMDCTNAHASTVYCIISIWGGKRFLTCSADAQIKLWGNTKEFNFESGLNEENNGRRRRRRNYYPPVCLGEMWGHTDQVKILLKLSETAFVSGGHDNQIILWRDGEEQSLKRNKEAVQALRRHNPLEGDDQDSSSGLVTASEAFGDDSTEKEDYDDEDEADDESEEQEISGPVQRRYDDPEGDPDDDSTVTDEEDAVLTDGSGKKRKNSKVEELESSSSEGKASVYIVPPSPGPVHLVYENIGAAGGDMLSSDTSSAIVRVGRLLGRSGGRNSKGSRPRAGTYGTSTPSLFYTGPSADDPTVNYESSPVKMGVDGIPYKSPVPHLYRAQSAVEMGSTAAGGMESLNSHPITISPSGSPYRGPTPPPPYIKKKNSEFISHTPLTISTLNERQQIRKVRVPVYIFEFAENLLKEEKFTLEDVKENLLKQGHSQGIVNAVITQLKQEHGI